MIAVHSYELYWTQRVQPQHLLTLVKANITGNAISRAENAQLAEYFMRQLDAFNKVTEKQKQFSVGAERASAEQVMNQVHHIHHAKEQEIKSRWLPEIDDKKADELIFKLELEQELDKIPDKVETPIKI